MGRYSLDNVSEHFIITSLIGFGRYNHKMVLNNTVLQLPPVPLTWLVKHWCQLDILYNANSEKCEFVLKL